MIIDGKKLANKLKEKLLRETLVFKKQKVLPFFLTFVAREDPEGNFYTKLKAEAAREIGIGFKKTVFSLKSPGDLNKLPGLIKNHSGNKKIHGLMIQKPSKEIVLRHFNNLNHFREFWISACSQIDYRKDIDCLTPQNLGCLLMGKVLFLPATAASIIKIILHILKAEKKLEGKNICILGSSEILGKPLALLLRDKGATINLCGSKTNNLKMLCRQADIIIACAGRPKLITKNMVKPGAILIDAGTKKVGRSVAGDADFTRLKNYVAYITPVPGGIGPLTVASLLENVLLATRRQVNERKIGYFNIR